MALKSGRTVLLLLQAAALLALLPAAVQPCGHHVVHKSIEELVRLHQRHQAAHLRPGMQGFATIQPAHAEDDLGGEAGDGGRDYDGLVTVSAGAAMTEEWPAALSGRDAGRGGQGDGDPDQHDGHEGHQHGGRGHGQQQGPGQATWSGEEAGAGVSAEEGGDEEGGAWEAEEEEGASNQEADVAAARRRRRLQQTNTTAPPPAPLRLSLIYQNMDLSLSQKQMVTRVVQAVARILRKFILVKRPPSGGLLVDPLCLETYRGACTLFYPEFSNRIWSNAMCGNATIDPAHITKPSSCSNRVNAAAANSLSDWATGPASGAGSGSSAYGTGCTSYNGTKGEATDMYLYITAVQNDDCDAGAAAWAQPCLLDLGDNRPLLGTANICPGTLRLLDEDTLTAVLTHEMIHALGFTDTMFNMTRRADGSPRPVSEVVSSTRINGRNVSRLITPGVRDAARDHFGCPSLSGAQLEEEGSQGSAGSHWEYTHYQGEIMVASTIFAADGSPPALSNLTLSYLEDTGWYLANRSAAGLLAWAAGTGCALPTSPSCSQYMATVPGQRLFCDPKTAVSSDGSPYFRCSDDYKATGVCRSLNFTGGCGLLVSNNAEQTCTGPDAANDLPDVFGWGTGSPSGRCLPVVYRFQARAGNGVYTFPSTGRDGDVDAACFDTVCSADGSKVYVKLFGQQFECPENKSIILPQVLRDRYQRGSIGPCPSAQALCSTQSCSAASCNPAGGDCLNGVCYCHLAYTGAGCTMNLITGAPVNDDSSSGSGGDSSSGSPAPPSPPPEPQWVQVVQITLSLYDTRDEVSARTASYRSALASWADMDVSRVKIPFIGSPLGSGNGSSYSDSGMSAGDAYSGSGRRRQRRQVLQTAVSLPSPASPLASSSSSPPPPAVGSVVTALITPGSRRGSTILMARLQDGTQRALLRSTLAQAGFALVPGSLVFESYVTLVTDTGSPPPSPGSAHGAALAGKDDSSSSGRLVIIIAIAAGAAAVVGIIGAVTAVYVIRARRARNQLGLSDAARRAERYAMHSNQAAGTSGGGGGGGSAGIATQGGAADPATHAYAPPAPGYPAMAGCPPGWGPGAPFYGVAGAGATAVVATPASPVASATPGPEAAAYSYYSARAAALAGPSGNNPASAPSASRGYQPPAPATTDGFPAPLYSGPQYGGYR